MIAPAELRRIENLADLAENFTRFQVEARNHRDRTAKILTATRFWVRDEHSGAFGPSKFLGFKGMDFWLYEQGKVGKTSGQAFQGTITREAIEAAIGASFHQQDRFVDECHEWGRAILGPHAFGNANPAKWRFLQIAIPGHELTSEYPDDLTQPEKFYEGAATIVAVNRYERNPVARAICIAHHGAKCRVCSMDFCSAYGEVGRGFIHVHHLKPIAEIGEEYLIDPIADLCPICPNCHAMIHRHRQTPLTIDELKAILNRPK